MFPLPPSDVRHRVAVIFSQRSRDAYAAEAHEKGQTYTFTDAWERPKTWLKGEYAYLAPNAASAFLNRLNIKHDFVEEAELDTKSMEGYKAILIPNAGHLAHETIGLLEDWFERTNGRLIVTGKSNLPLRFLGLAGMRPAAVSGYTGWRWQENTPFSDRAAWEEYYVTGYLGHLAHQVEPASGCRTMAQLVEFTGDYESSATATKRVLGPAIVVGERTVYVSNQVFELIGGVLQAHLKVEDVRQWNNPTHWGDTILLFLRHMLLEVGLQELWQTRLRAFGAYDGAFSFRQDSHGHQEFSFLDYEEQNLIPATFDIEDPSISSTTTPEQAHEWVRRVKKYEFLEVGLHNDSVFGDPPLAVRGRGLYDHIASASENLHFPVYTCGRHGGGHMHPETLDAMDYLYSNYDHVLGMCTFSFYHMIEYGVRDPRITVDGKRLTYATNPQPTIATPGFWYPYHAVVTTDKEWRVLRGWDRTHDYDCAYDLVDTIFEGHNSAAVGKDSRLENPVVSLQYHPEHARNPAQNNGRGILGYLRYAINLAERRNFWIANQRQLYERMSDYQDVIFSLQDDGSVLLHNPTNRLIKGLAMEHNPRFGSVWDGADELIHVVDASIVTLPPLNPGERKVIHFAPHTTGAPLVAQPNNKGSNILDARHNHQSGETWLTVSVCRDQCFRLERVTPGASYRVQVDSEPEKLVQPEVYHATHIKLSAEKQRSNTDEHEEATASQDNPLIFIRVDVTGDQHRFNERTIRIRLA